MTKPWSLNSRNTIAVMGDSVSRNDSLGVLAHQFWPSLVCNMLNAAGCHVKTRNLGISGQTTAQMLARMSGAFTYDVPELGVILGGTNDLNAGNQSTVAASPAPTTTTFSVQSGKGPTFPVGTWILVGNGLQSTQVTAQAADALTVSPAITAPVSTDPVVIDTQKCLVAIGNTFRASGCPSILFVTYPYLNWSSGGDTSSNNGHAVLDAKIKAAAAACSAPVVDLYAYMMPLVGTGGIVQGDHLWQVLDANVHPSILGNKVMAQAVFNGIQANPGLAALV